MIRRAQVATWLEADTDSRTLHLVIEAHAAQGEGDVVLHRVDLTSALAGPQNADKRRKLRDLFTARTAP